MKYYSNLKKYYKTLRPVINKYYTFGKKSCLKTAKLIKSKMASWWHIIAATAFAVIFLYYPLGGLIISNTSTPSFQPQSDDQGLSTIDSLNFLIAQEVHHKIWTPNLPILFPSYFLDNMPNFQLGVISAVSSTAQALDKFSFETSDTNSRNDLHKAAELLQYPGNIWLFSPQNSLKPATSSSTQYKKSRRLLKNFNLSLIEGKTTLPLDESNFVIVLKRIRKDLNNLVKTTSDHVRENQDLFIDTKSDDIFYNAYGKIYAYAQIAKGLGHDFKDVLVDYDIYAIWSSLIKTLDETSSFEPWIVRNGQLQSSFSPNHLITLSYQASRSINYLNAMINQLP